MYVIDFFIGNKGDISWLTSCGHQTSNHLISSLSLNQVCVVCPCRQRKENNMTELDINKLFISVHTSASCWYCRREVYVVMNLQAHFSTTHIHVFPFSVFTDQAHAQTSEFYLAPLFLSPTILTSGRHFPLFSSSSFSVKTG